MTASTPKCASVWTSASATRCEASTEVAAAAFERCRIARSGSRYSTSCVERVSSKSVSSSDSGPGAAKEGGNPQAPPAPDTPPGGAPGGGKKPKARGGYPAWKGAHAEEGAARYHPPADADECGRRDIGRGSEGSAETVGDPA